MCKHRQGCSEKANTRQGDGETGHKQDIERKRQDGKGHSFGNQQLAEKKISDISVEDKRSMQIRGWLHAKLILKSAGRERPRQKMTFLVKVHKVKR